MSKDTIFHNNCKFVKYISENKINSRILSIANDMNASFYNKHPLILCVLNGAVYFTMDLVKHFNFKYKIDFIKITSYKDMKRGAITCNNFDFNILNGQDVVIIEDIIDSGKTLEFLIDKIEDYKLKSLSIATLLKKKSINNINNFAIDYCGFEINDKYVIGYGLDINNLFRDLKDIYIKDG